jgi:hypothetical protein
MGTSDDDAETGSHIDVLMSLVVVAAILMAAVMMVCWPLYALRLFLRHGYVFWRLGPLFGVASLLPLVRIIVALYIVVRAAFILLCVFAVNTLDQGTLYSSIAYYMLPHNPVQHKFPIIISLGNQTRITCMRSVLFIQW